MNFSHTRAPARFLAPEGIQGSASGGHAPDAMLPANKDTADLPGGGGHAGSHHTMPSRADIAQLAEKLWEQEGRPDDRSLDHWFRAEEMLRHRAGLS